MNQSVEELMDYNSFDPNVYNPDVYDLTIVSDVYMGANETIPEPNQTEESTGINSMCCMESLGPDIPSPVTVRPSQEMVSPSSSQKRSKRGRKPLRLSPEKRLARKREQNKGASQRRRDRKKKQKENPIHLSNAQSNGTGGYYLYFTEQKYSVITTVLDKLERGQSKVSRESLCKYLCALIRQTPVFLNN